jgi:hypothetical protein
MSSPASEVAPEVTAGVDTTDSDIDPRLRQDIPAGV